MIIRSAKFALFLTVAAISVASYAQVEPNGFLNKPALTQAALIKQVQEDPVVMGRYMRHFGMSAEEIVAYFKTLKLDTLKQDAVYLVYNTPETGEIRAKAIFYKKGTAVWVDPVGNIVLKTSCGNPMVRGTDTLVAPKPVTPIDVEVSGYKMEEIVLPTVPSEATWANIPATIESSALTIPAAPPQAILPIVTQQFNPFLLAPLAVIPFINTGSGPDPIPEPATMAVLGAGAALLLARRRKNRQ
ncbi:PEP-CTERM sorting domain-containing protein [Kamptonema cortianum]|nr:PEP-CTERM sorting domain-containing protein [Geitlerinema splendidum]MDK3157559.1 PEP-CTERM sorting domain-containing protein [Kamptonema cortianum]